MKKLILITVVAALLSSCAIIRPGEVALKVRYGKVQPKILEPGTYGRGLFFTKVERFDTRVTEYSDRVNFHSSEGIEVSSEITLLYKLVPDSVISIYRKFDGYYQQSLIVNNLITVLRQEGLNHTAVELITQRSEIEQAIKEKLAGVVGDYGFEIDLVLLKDVELPAEIIRTIREKLNAEMVSEKTEVDIGIQRKNLAFTIEKEKKEAELDVAKKRIALDFVVEKQEREAERLLIEAEAVKKSNDILNASLTDKVIEYKALEITRDLVRSPNAKIIITDGKSPVLLNEK
ncbi:prohibitin family protein [Gaoshiqia sp. Z1-71]|uniref:prohibitin family protein n=1 Tax=Gaoshiqia hydrogeniformans TaxID=3290090 RepID=UPI003BF8C262